jgi:hypothetical protein
MRELTTQAAPNTSRRSLTTGKEQEMGDKGGKKDKAKSKKQITKKHEQKIKKTQDKQKKK